MYDGPCNCDCRGADSGPSPGRPAPRRARSQRPRAPPPAPSERVIQIDGRDVPIQIARHRLARRYVVRVIADGGVRLTVPPRRVDCRRARVRRTADRTWIARANRASAPARGAVDDRHRVRFRGELVSLVVSRSRSCSDRQRIRRSTATRRRPDRRSEGAPAGARRSRAAGAAASTGGTRRMSRSRASRSATSDRAGAPARHAASSRSTGGSSRCRRASATTSSFTS